MASFRHQPAFAARLQTLHRRYIKYLVLMALLFVISGVCPAQTRRVVIIKVDGLPYDLLDEFVKERDPRTGKSRLPWIDHVFYKRGSRLSNFYVRGMSLSAPSWSTLDTGQHLQIKGNVEFDRYTLHAYDYLNFIPFYLKSAAGARIDMPGTEVLDSLGQPLLFDAFPHEERYISFQLYQRGMRFATLKNAMQNRFMRPPRELWDEWTMGLEIRNAFFVQMERELREKLNDSRIRYLDLYVSSFDHVAHHNHDRASHLNSIKEIDAIVGRVWSAIEKSPMASETALIVVSDHGFNTDERVYSQGYNLVKLLGSTNGGGHHVVTKRRLMLDYSLKGINFLVPLITTTTSDSYYLKGRSTEYPTALLDFDGNERASIHLRDSDLNLLHILLQQLQRNKLSPAVRAAVIETFFQTIDAKRSMWQANVDNLDEELAVVRRRIAEQQQLVAAQPKKFTPEEIIAGKDDQKIRVFAQLERWTTYEKDYSEYTRTLRNLLALRRNTFAPNKIKIEDFIAPNAMGERNSIYELQNYVVGLAANGFVLDADGKLDTQNSFRRVDYFSLLHGLNVRNNVQPEVSSQPVDMVLYRIPTELLTSLPSEIGQTRDAVWIYGGTDSQALILAREDAQGRMSLKYQPIKNLRQDSTGKISFEPVSWKNGLPLRILEDSNFGISQAQRTSWLSDWHTEEEWLEVLHKTKYSTGLIGVYEQMARPPVLVSTQNEDSVSPDTQLMRRFGARQRELTETDLQLVANDHWNFDVRGFNPGGNHGSFFRISTHSTLMLAGGSKTGIAHGQVVEEPYDTLSFVPTVLALTGHLSEDNKPIPILWEKGFRRFPGKPIKQLLVKPDSHKIAVTGATATP